MSQVNNKHLSLLHSIPALSGGIAADQAGLDRDQIRIKAQLHRTVLLVRLVRPVSRSVSASRDLSFPADGGRSTASHAGDGHCCVEYTSCGLNLG